MEKLVLFSGGKDSFIAACKIASAGDTAVLFSCNGGGMVAEAHLLHGVARLEKRFGSEHIRYAGIYPTSGLIQALSEYWINTSLAELAKEYPHLTNCQVRCLHCQASMWAAAIAYAVAKRIPVVAAGYRHNDVFCTGLEGFRLLMEELAASRDIAVEFPVWNLYEEDWERDEVMVRYSFEPAVLEPKCLLGTPVRNGFPTEEREDMVKYTANILLPGLRAVISRIIPVFGVIHLGHTTHEPWPVDLSRIGEGGIF